MCVEGVNGRVFRGHSRDAVGCVAASRSGVRPAKVSDFPAPLKMLSKRSR